MTGEPVMSNGQQAIVVGAGPGLGRSMALRLADQGFDLALIARDAGNLEVLAEEIRAAGRQAVTVVCDASDPIAVAAAVTTVADQGPIGMLVYNAAARAGRLIDVDLTVLQQATNVNVLAPIAAVQAARPSLQATGGSVLLTGGGFALYPNAEAGVLSLGKSALRAAAHLLADDLAPLGVHVRTLIIAGIIEPGGPFDPDAIAAAFLALQADPNATVERIFRG